MKGSERRSQILEALSASEVAVSGSSLAQAVGVSRQVVVQDIALLRANGHDIIATNKGYVLRDGADAPQIPTRLIKVCHGLDEVADELTTIVDLGGTVLTGMVNHRVYGTITGVLDIKNRKDVERYLENIHSGKSSPLLMVTSGYHFHRIAADTEAELDEIEHTLCQKGYLAEVLPYEGDLQ